MSTSDSPVWSSPELIHLSEIVQSKQMHFALPPAGCKHLCTLYGPWGHHDVMLTDDDLYLVDCPSQQDATSLYHALHGEYVVIRDELSLLFYPKAATALREPATLPAAFAA